MIRINNMKLPKIKISMDKFKQLPNKYVFLWKSFDFVLGILHKLENIYIVHSMAQAHR